MLHTCTLQTLLSNHCWQRRFLLSISVLQALIRSNLSNANCPDSYYILYYMRSTQKKINAHLVASCLEIYYRFGIHCREPEMWYLKNICVNFEIGGIRSSCTYLYVVSLYLRVLQVLNSRVIAKKGNHNYCD